ncbi:MAG TPA: M28 family metallopeptidase [Candidatus Gastranaerophilaceae bacterium]|nr:M28 family metallopeptidase [Candidatus Gastranaerophilaceae bacterium]
MIISVNLFNYNQNGFKINKSPVFFGANLVSPKEVQNFIRLISKQKLQENMLVLTSPETQGRAIGTQGIEIASQFIEAQFEKIGLEPFCQIGLKTFSQPFLAYQPKLLFEENLKNIYGWIRHKSNPPEIPAKNIVGIIRGKNPEKYLMLTAHYDHLGSIPEKNLIFPGANDNASGVSVLLELARIFKKIKQPEKSIIFAALSDEEGYKKGAQTLAQSLIDNEIHSIDIINMDMLGGQKGNTIDLWQENKKLSVNIVGAFKQTCDTLGLKLRLHRGDPCSDATMFNIEGMPVVCASWDFLSKVNTRFFHTNADTVDKINPEILEKAAKAIGTASLNLIC